MIRKKAFTMIELMIAISIIAILSMLTYAPYNYYQNKAKLKITAREISQLLYEARNMAINGTIENSSNVSIGVYFDNSNTEKNTIKVFSYPYDIITTDINNIVTGNIKLLKTLRFKEGIQIDSVESKDDLLFFFDAISGNLKYYSWEILGTRVEINNANTDIIDINFSYKGSTSPNLQKKIEYITNTNIIDY